MAMKIVSFVFLSVILSLSIISSIIGLSINSLLYPEIYQNSLQKNNVYDSIEKLIENQTSQNGFNLIDSRIIIPSINSNLENILAYIRSDEDVLNFTIEINISAFKPFFRAAAENITICSNSQQPFVNDKIICRPLNISSSEFIDMALEKKGFDTSKSAINLADVFDKERNIDKVRNAVYIYKIVLYISLSLLVIIPLLFFFLSGLKSSFRWAGLTFILTGFIFTIISFSVLVLYPLINVPEEFRNLVFDIINPLTIKLIIYSVSALALGVVFFILSFFVGESNSGESN